MKERKMKEDELYMMFKAEMEEEEDRGPEEGAGERGPGEKEVFGDYCNGVGSTKK